MGNTGCYGCGGVPVPTPYPVPTGVATGIAPAIIAPPLATTTRIMPPMYGGVDMDPITPGIQTRPGVVTPVGPPMVRGGPGAFVGGMRPGFAGGASVVRPY